MLSPLQPVPRFGLLAQNNCTYNPNHYYWVNHTQHGPLQWAIPKGEKNRSRFLRRLKSLFKAIPNAAFNIQLKGFSPSTGIARIELKEIRRVNAPDLTAQTPVTLTK